MTSKSLRATSGNFQAFLIGFSIFLWVININEIAQIVSLIQVAAFFQNSRISVNKYTLLSIILLCIIVIGNLYIGNYPDLIARGFIKALILVLFASTLSRFLRKANRQELDIIRYSLWLSLFASLIYTGYDLWYLPQFMTFLFVFLIEELNRIKYRRSILHIFSIVILFTSLKKQIIAIVILLKIIMRPSRGLFFALAGLILISIAPFVWRTVAPSSAEFLERRASSFLSERFLKPNPYGNMRLYLVVEYAPTVLTKNWLFGYGLERYGSYSALGSGRDIERSVLGMDDFISRDFNSTSRFGSVSADVGLLTIWMQMGVSGLLLYAFLVRSVCRNTLGFLKTVLISLPFMAGGAAISSVGFIFLISTISAFLDLKVGKRA